MSVRKNVIRQGDRVRVVVPKFVERVGYPKCLEDYRAEVAERFDATIAGMFKAITGGDGHDNAKQHSRIISELAYLALRKDRFGGRERSIHWREVPEYAGVECSVWSVRTVTTGKYCEGRQSSGNGWSCDEWEPPQLDDERRWRVAHLSICDSNFVDSCDTIVEHLEKL